jgi:hypothetical protein
LTEHEPYTGKQAQRRKLGDVALLCIWQSLAWGIPVPSHDCMSGKEAHNICAASPNWPSGLPKDARIVSKVKPLATIPRTTSAVSRNASHRMPIVKRAIGLRLEPHLRRTTAQATQQKATINGVSTATAANGPIAGSRARKRKVPITKPAQYARTKYAHAVWTMRMFVCLARTRV